MNETKETSTEKGKPRRRGNSCLVTLFMAMFSVPMGYVISYFFQSEYSAKFYFDPVYLKDVLTSMKTGPIVILVTFVTFIVTLLVIDIENRLIARSNNK